MHKNSDKPAFPFSDPDTRQGRRLNLDDGPIPRYLCVQQDYEFVVDTGYFRSCYSPGVILGCRVFVI